MAGIGIWQIDGEQPRRLAESEITLEQHLEEWIARDPSLLERGLQVVARQLRTDAGPLDLLALDPQGRWVLIEIKRERLRREVIAQAVDYAACIARLERDRLRESCDRYLSASGTTLQAVMETCGGQLDDDSDSLEIVIYLVGTAVDPGLERMVRYLSARTSLAIRLVTFSVFQGDGGAPMLAREIHEPLDLPTSSGPAAVGSKTPTVEELLRRADANGVGRIARVLTEASVDVGLCPMPKARSIMVAPPRNRSRCLIYLPVDREQHIREGRLQIYLAAEAFEEFFGLTRTTSTGVLGGDEYEWIDEGRAEELAGALRSLLGVAPRSSEANEA